MKTVQKPHQSNREVFQGETVGRVWNTTEWFPRTVKDTGKKRPARGRPSERWMDGVVKVAEKVDNRTTIEMKRL